MRARTMKRAGRGCGAAEDKLEGGVRARWQLAIGKRRQGHARRRQRWERRQFARVIALSCGWRWKKIGLSL